MRTKPYIAVILFIALLGSCYFPTGRPDILIQLQDLDLTLSDPTGMASHPDAPANFYIYSSDGTITAYDENFTSSNYMTVGSVATGGERGLLGMAFHPDFESNGYFYVYYTVDDSGLKSRVSRFTSNSGNTSGNASSETVLLEVAQPFANHNGGSLEFGPDGYLFIALGDGGSAGDPAGNGQNKNTLLGSILRIDVDNTSSGKEYAIPSGNPFARSGGEPEIFAYGFRNPWKISYDVDTEKLWVADVGQSDAEEINIVSTSGGNYGWNITEGSDCYNGDPCTPSDYTLPIFEYGHTGGRVAVIGGYVYRGLEIPALRSYYVFSDFGSGELLILHSSAPFEYTNSGVSMPGVRALGLDKYGELYVLTDTDLFKIIDATP